MIKYKIKAPRDSKDPKHSTHKTWWSIVEEDGLAPGGWSIAYVQNEKLAIIILGLLEFRQEILADLKQEKE